MNGRGGLVRLVVCEILLRLITTVVITHMKTKVHVGMEFRSIIADCNALWQVKKHLGRGSWLCEVVNEPIVVGNQTCDGEHAGIQKAFLSKDILGSVGLANLFEGIANENERYLQSLAVGAIIHYHHGFGQYVRREVVLHEGQKKLKDILLGLWRPYDLPHRAPDGSVSDSYCVSCVKSGELYDRLQCSTTYEHSSFSRPRGEGTDFDPRKQKPIDLTLPPMTEQQAEAARLWQLLAKVQAVLSQQEAGDQYHPDTPKTRLREAWEQLEIEFNNE